LSESSGPTEPGQRVERDVENLISEAATLAGDLSDEVAGDDNAAPETTDRERRFFESHATSEPDIESQLSTAADQVADASNEIGGATSINPRSDSTALAAAKAAPTQNAAKPTHESQPDVNASSALDTQSPAKKKAPKKLVLPPRRTKKDADIPDALADAATAESAAKPDDEDSNKAVALDDNDVVESDSGNDMTQAAGHGATSSGSMSAGPSAYSPSMARIASLLHGPAQVLVSVLDLVDRPFGRLGPIPRVLAGWAALIFFVAAVSLLIFFVL